MPSITSDQLAAINAADVAFSQSFAAVGPAQDEVSTAESELKSAQDKLASKQQTLSDAVNDCRVKRGALDSALDAAGLTPLTVVVETAPTV